MKLPAIPSNHDPVIFSGRRISELSLDELRRALRYFHDAYLEAEDEREKALRRMKKMEMALTKGQIRVLDAWLRQHPSMAHDAVKGDGSPMWREWNE